VRHSAPDTYVTPDAHSALTRLPSWHAFVTEARQHRLDSNILRIIDAAGLALDISAQHQSSSLDTAFGNLLNARDFKQQRQQLLAGAPVNLTESRPAWHSALRAPAPPDPAITHERARVNAFVRMADSKRRWRNIVHIGIGGSDWGVRLAVRAFGYTGMWRKVRFVSNIDGHAIAGGLAGLDPHDTLIVLASKSFTTAETLKNGARAVEWLKSGGLSNPWQNVVAITAETDRACQWGVLPDHVFRLWEWVGGRFSIWSALSLTVALAINTDVVAGMHSGAAAMDAHFVEAPLAHNAPVQMAMAGIINRSIHGYGSLNLAPYDFRLTELVPYIQQLEMESLGKSTLVGGAPADVPTGPAVWGMPGTDAQHTFFQWLHQGSDGAPVDFIVCQHADHSWPEHHRSLLANCLAQREALLQGKGLDAARQESLRGGASESESRWLAHHRTHAGGRPSSLIVLPRLSPYTLGSLLALYEHKVFVQSVVWGINAFDQWGVEYGKTLAGNIDAQLAGKPASAQAPEHDASTAHWIHTFGPQS